MMTGEIMASYGLVTPFLTDDFMFAAGVEFGMFYHRIKKQPKIIRDYILPENQDRILVLADRFGYNVVKMKHWDKYWLWIKLRRRKDARHV